MKKLVFLFSAVILTAMSVNVFAQSTGTAPSPGAKHSYSITPGNAGNTLLWTVTKGNLTTPATANEVTLSSTSGSSIDITWDDTLTVNRWLYVHILETDGAGCSNEKVLPVQIKASPFNLTLDAPNATACYNNSVVVSLADASTPNYDHGNTTIVFTVTPTGLSSSYSGYSFDLGIAYGAYTGLSQTVALSINGSISGSTVTVSDNNPVTITYTVDNTNVYTNASAANAQNYTATATITGGKAINGVSDNNGGIYTDETAVSRPNTSGITTN